MDHVLPIQDKVNMGVMLMKGESTLPRTSDLDPHNQMHFSVITRTSTFFVGLTPL